MSNTDFHHWNGTAIAHMFQRLITKTHHPYNKEPLSLAEFTEDYNTLAKFIQWRKEQHDQRNFYDYLLYNFTQENMNELMSLIDYETDNETLLQEIWSKKIMFL